MKKMSLIFAFFAIASLASAQKILLEEGNLNFLKGQKYLKVEYVFDNMPVGKFATEKEYIAYKVTPYNKEEPGKGDKWLNGWNNAKTNLYPPKFEELLNEYTSKKGLVALQNKSEATYTLILKTTYIEPGYNIGISRAPASINVEYIFVETANPSKVVAKLSARKVPGRDAMGYDYDAGTRISEGYAKAGKILGTYLQSTVLK